LLRRLRRSRRSRRSARVACAAHRRLHNQLTFERAHLAPEEHDRLIGGGGGGGQLASEWRLDAAECD